LIKRNNIGGKRFIMNVSETLRQQKQRYNLIEFISRIGHAY
jgi:hypothetical protein